MKIANFIPFLSAVAWLGAWWWLNRLPGNFLIIDAMVAVFCLAAGLIVTAKAKEKHWWNAAILPLVSNTVVLGYLTIVSNAWLINVVVILLTLLNYVYWRFVFYFYNAPARYTSFSLENLSFYVNFLNVFFLGALAYGLRSFLQYDFWLILPGVALALSLIIYQGLWAAKVEWRKYGRYFPAYLIILLECFGGLSLLPLNHHMLGFLWASLYYLLLIIFNDLINRRLKNKRLRFYLLLVVAGWLILLLSATWL